LELTLEFEKNPALGVDGSIRKLVRTASFRVIRQSITDFADYIFVTGAFDD
jgi:hypothetical protein